MKKPEYELASDKFRYFLGLDLGQANDSVENLLVAGERVAVALNGPVIGLGPAIEQLGAVAAIHVGHGADPSSSASRSLRI